MKQIDARVETDSIGPHGVRLVTIVGTFPRCVLAEVNTHRAISKNSASSRAIPVERMIQMVTEDPFIPTHWTTAQKGMQGGPELTDPSDIEECRMIWLQARDRAINSARELLGLGLHKQLVNRVLEPFMWHTVVMTATEWGNFLALRDHEAAEPHFRDFAHIVLDRILGSTPIEKKMGQWHLPFSDDLGDLPIKQAVSISVGRCARVSYLNHEGIRDFADDLRLYGRIVGNGHMSPTEHAARCMGRWHRSGNFIGWFQHRKDFPNENRNHPLIHNNIPEFGR